MSNAREATSHAMVRLSGVRRWFTSAGGEEVRAVDDVSFAAYPGTLTVLMGPSGSGKTTLLSLIGGLLAPTGGTVEVAGRLLGTLDQPALTAFRLAHIGIVYQAFHLIDALPVVENVELPMTLMGDTRPDTARRARALLEQTGLSHRLHAWPRTLSGGEQQRCAIARALANNPPLLLADEPTGSLDARSGEAVIGLLRAEAHAGGRTIIVATHDERLLHVADQVLKLDYGRLIASTSGGTGSGPGTPGTMESA
jgi:putative ABC transport system ATP-binding protein